MAEFTHTHTTSADGASSVATSNFSGRSFLNVSKYPSVPNGLLPVNDCSDVHDPDMFSMDHRIPFGAEGPFWYLTVSIDYVENEDFRGTMLLGMSSILETFPLIIAGFELHPLDTNSSLPFLTSNRVQDGFP